MTVYRHICAERAQSGFAVSVMCEVLGVRVSGYWAWTKRAPSDRALGDAWLLQRIRQIHEGGGGRYGSPRVHAMLAREGIGVGEKRVARVMAQAGLQGAKEKLLHERPEGGWATRAEPRSAVFEYIERFCNPTRIHSTLGMRSPVEYETDHENGDPDADSTKPGEVQTVQSRGGATSKPRRRRRGVHYWVRPSGSIEFANVVTHDDMSIPE